MITDAFGSLFLRTINHPAANPVHLLFNQWWQHAPEDVKQAYVDGFLKDPQFASFITERYLPEPLDIAEMETLAPGSLGRSYYDWIVDNDLMAAIATNYRQFHELIETSGMLDGMPELMRFVVLRGFQTHDFLHVITGYDSSGTGEIALQAFCLAQMRFPYFGMWMSVITTQMTFLRPQMIVPIMDAISDGWHRGRNTPNLMVEKWETMLADDLAEIRARYRVTSAPTPYRVPSPADRSSQPLCPIER